ncbi:hypothetical protein BC830DRAFT_1231146 [Chytriomyces sp. MP71]|nr:hypothetical protein BC830DRAFT_1231146 [Chytriomyces sp. MP71]
MPKPFSSKQKKAQLSAKRERLRGREDGGDASLSGDQPGPASSGGPQPQRHDDDTGHSAHAVPSATKPVHSVSVTSVDAQGRAVAGNQRSLMSVFAKLTHAEMEERKKESRQPFVRLPPSALEVGFDDLYPDPRKVISFPRRPPWHRSESKETVEEREQLLFDAWIKRVYQEWDPAELSYFEHNLDVWRQLWRVVEISDVVLFVVDARHPVLHFPPTLFDYVVTRMKKKLVLVFNKIDLIDAHTLQAWKQYFQNRFPGLHTAAFSIYPPEAHLPDDPGSAHMHATRAKLSKRVQRYVRAVGVGSVLRACRDVELLDAKGVQVDWEGMIAREEEVKRRKDLEEAKKRLRDGEIAVGRSGTSGSTMGGGPGKKKGPQHLVNLDSDVDGVRGGGRKQQYRRDRENMLKNEPVQPEDSDEGMSSDEGSDTDNEGVEVSTLQADERDPRTDMITIGLIGHPLSVPQLTFPMSSHFPSPLRNVGKSSLINGILGKKVVSTSATPGHTKHFQTIHINKSVRLCDCPGLVFPAVLPKPVQILSGMYRIAQVQEPYSAVQYLAERVPIEEVLHLQPPLVSTGLQDAVSGSAQARAEQHRVALERYQWSGWDICEAFAIQRGFLTPRVSRPDVYRAANLLLRMANDGRLLLGFKPPGYFEEKQVGPIVSSSPVENVGDKGVDENEYDEEEYDENENEDGDLEDEFVTSKPKTKGNAFALLALDYGDENDE